MSQIVLPASQNVHPSDLFHFHSRSSTALQSLQERTSQVWESFLDQRYGIFAHQLPPPQEGLVEQIRQDLAQGSYEQALVSIKLLPSDEREKIHDLGDLTDMAEKKFLAQFLLLCPNLHVLFSKPPYSFVNTKLAEALGGFLCKESKIGEYEAGQLNKRYVMRYVNDSIRFFSLSCRPQLLETYEATLAANLCNAKSLRALHFFDSSLHDGNCLAAISSEAPLQSLHLRKCSGIQFGHLKDLLCRFSFKELSLPFLKFESEDELLEALVEMQDLESLDLSSTRITHLREHMPLRRCNLSSCRHLVDQRLTPFFNQGESLETLLLSDTSLNGECLTEGRFNLSTVDFSSSRFMVEENLTRFFRSRPFDEEAGVTFLFSHMNSTGASLAEIQGQSFERVDFSFGRCLQEPHLAAFFQRNNFENLKALSLSGIPTTGACIAQTRMCKLEDLDLSFCPLRPEEVQTLLGINSFNFLRRLALRGVPCVGVFLSNLRSIAIRHLDLSFCTDLDEVALGEFFREKGKALRCLRMENTNSDGSALRFIPKRVSKMTLVLRGSPITGNSLQRLNSHRFQEVDFSFCTKLQDGDIAVFFQRNRVRTLKRLALSGTSTTGQCLTGLTQIKKLCRLEELDLSSCPLQEQFLETFFQETSLKFLKRLKLCSTPITGRCLLSLKCDGLEDVDFSSCQSLDDDPLGQFFEEKGSSLMAIRMEGTNSDGSPLSRIPPQAPLRILSLKGSPIRNHSLVRIGERTEGEIARMSARHLKETSHNYFFQLEELDLSFCQLPEQDMRRFLWKNPFPFLKRLFLAGLPIEGPCLLPIRCASLEEVDFSDCKDLQEDPLEAFLRENSSSLTSLNLSNTRTSGKALLQIPFQAPLRVLKLRNIPLEKGILKQIHGHAFDEVDVSFCREIDDNELSPFFQNNSVRQFHLQGTSITGESLSQIHGYSSEELDFSDCRQLQDDYLRDFIRNNSFSFLRRLCVANTRLEGGFLSEVNGQFLEEADFSFRGLEEDTLKTFFAKGVPLLKRLSLCGTAIKGKCLLDYDAELESLDLSFCENLEEDILENFFQKKGSSLRFLGLSGTGVSADISLFLPTKKSLAVFHFAQLKTDGEDLAGIEGFKFEEVDFSDSPNLKDEHLGIFFQNNDSCLRCINLAGTSITGECLEKISIEAPLRKLDITGCLIINKSIVYHTLKKRFPNMEIIDKKQQPSFLREAPPKPPVYESDDEKN